MAAFALAICSLSVADEEDALAGGVSDGVADFAFLVVTFDAAGGSFFFAAATELPRLRAVVVAFGAGALAVVGARPGVAPILKVVGLELT